MKSLEEKKLLVKMAKTLGQPVDQAMIESAACEEKLAAAFFGKPKKDVKLFYDDKIQLALASALTALDEFLNASVKGILNVAKLSAFLSA